MTQDNNHDTAAINFRTHSYKPLLIPIIDEFKASTTKPRWLVENRDRLKKYDIDVDALIDMWMD